MLAARSDIVKDIRSSRIMVVDDNEINRLFIEKALAAKGFTSVLGVASAEEALSTLTVFGPDIVILDVMMPGMNGFECVAEIRKRPGCRDLPVLIQTVLADPEERVKAFAQGATDFISKPIYPDELCARVQVHLENRLAMTELQIYKQRVQVELESARQLQLAILPSGEDITEIERRCALDVAAHFMPSSELGGDSWGIRNLFPYQVSLWLADLSGHGVASALNVFRLQAYMKEYTSLAARPGEYLSHLNDKLLQILMRGQFATMFYGIVDTWSNQLLYATACSPHPILLRRATGRAEVIDGSGTPLGIGMHHYATRTTPFSPGDMILLYSDALTETPNSVGQCLAEEDIVALLEEHPKASSQYIKEALVERFSSHCGGKVRDDLTFVVCSRATF